MSALFYVKKELLNITFNYTPKKLNIGLSKSKIDEALFFVNFRIRF